MWIVKGGACSGRALPKCPEALLNSRAGVTAGRRGYPRENRKVGGGGGRDEKSSGAAEVDSSPYRKLPFFYLIFYSVYFLHS